ncbi:serine/threonine-protein kinase [Nannocystis radixulma]|uniref:Serine/threonine-protein kinase n=1 Tax=Nannocystis radixulma TaxID=2995305 RepID=A0ABT5BEN9_9BACT|nr:serine/threonine-protein kinase [Nannocystis radixulma]MDC0671888.1 serine/threonine-protein kinase [Nannocystis radixulma]
MHDSPPTGSDPTMAAGTGPFGQVADERARDQTWLADSADRTILQTGSRPGLVPDPDAKPERLGRYLVLERLGAGGMGVVYAAFDPDLERKVAIKLIRGRADDAARARLQREAQAMAKLSHPAVVAVFDVGEYQGQLFVAMEFVRGETVAAWIRRSKRSWREVLAVFLAAGRGLAAAHDAGLVHRDFKPDNVLLDPDGRPKVTDFGLARAVGPGEAHLGHHETDGDQASEDRSVPVAALEPALVLAGEHALSGALSLPLTRLGAVMGTPAYMAAEQHRGLVADARTDQYAFCVSLFEALHGELPFAGSNLFELAGNVVAGRLREPTSGRRVPAFVQRALVRGLSPEPGRRWPDMHALLRALDRDPARTLRRLAGGGLLLALGAGAAVVATAAPDKCTGAAERLAGAWDEARADAVAAALRATGAPWADETWSIVRGGLDRYARTWSIIHEQTCMSHQRGEASGELLDLQMACLDERRDDLAAFVDVLAEADAGVAEQAVLTLAALPRVERCTDVLALRTGIPAPAADEEQEVAAIRGRLARARAELAAGRYPRAFELAHAAEADARRLGYRPLVAEAALRLGAVRQADGKADLAEAALDEAWAAALATRHDEVAAEAAIEQVAVVGRELARKDDGQRWAVTAGALVDRRGRDDDLAARLQVHLGNMYIRTGAIDQAVSALRRALVLYTAELGDSHPYVAAARTALGDALRRQGRFADAAAEHQRALRDTVAVYGPAHPQVAVARNNLGVAYGWLGRHDDAIVEYRAAIAVREQALGGDHPRVASARNNLATALLEQGRLDEAEAELQRAIAGFRRADHPDLADAENNLGNLHFAAGRPHDALAAYEAALAAETARLGPDALYTSLSRSNVGTALWQLGRLDDAERELRRSLAALERELPATHPYLAFPLLGLGAVLADRGDAHAGEAFLQRALALAEAQDDPGLRATVRSELARARAEKHHSSQPHAETLARARRDVEAALADLRRAGPLYAHAARRAEAFLAAP